VEIIYKGFGPTRACGYWKRKKHQIGSEQGTVRKVDAPKRIVAGRKQQAGKVHMWRCEPGHDGGVVQWEPVSTRWLEGRGEVYLNQNDDDGHQRLFAGFV